jgi:hypothetical protein
LPTWSAEGPITTAFTADDSGFTFTVTGIEGVAAIAQAAPGAAMGAAIVEQGLIGNQVKEHNVNRRTMILGSFRNNQGIVNVNQDSGNLNNQANVRVLAMVEAGSLVYDLKLTGLVQRIDNVLISSGGERQDRIASSFREMVGIAGVNQSAGNLNQQANVLVLGVGLALGPEMVTLGDVILEEVNANNTLTQGPLGPRTDAITGAFRDFRGIAQVSQSAGDLNAVSNFLGVSLTVMDGR